SGGGQALPLLAALALDPVGLQARLRGVGAGGAARLAAADRAGLHEAAAAGQLAGGREANCIAEAAQVHAAAAGVTAGGRETAAEALLGGGVEVVLALTGARDRVGAAALVAAAALGLGDALRDGRRQGVALGAALLVAAAAGLAAL